VIAEKRKQRHYTITQRDTLHYGPDAQMTEAQQIALDSVIEPVDKQSDGKEQHRALHYSANYLWCGLKLALYQRQIARDTHDEQEEWENQITGRHTVPLRVSQHLKTLAPTVVYQYHACHGDTSQDVERQ
jgi:hypothetical protein